MDIITAEELNRRIEAGEDLRHLDVRESFEANISDFRMETLSIPVASLDEQLHKLDKEKEYIVYCRSGNTSKKAVELLLENGSDHVKNVEGGINGWAQGFDPSLPQCSQTVLFEAMVGVQNNRHCPYNTRSSGERGCLQF